MRSWANVVFQNRGVCGQAFPSFPSPSPVTPFFCSLPNFLEELVRKRLLRRLQLSLSSFLFPISSFLLPLSSFLFPLSPFPSPLSYCRSFSVLKILTGSRPLKSCKCPKTWFRFLSPGRKPNVKFRPIKRFRIV